MTRMFFVLPCCLCATFVHANPLPLADQNRALKPIIISPNASDGTKAVAGELADYLGRITGAKFEVQVGDGSRGIVLGTLAEFPKRRKCWRVRGRVNA